MAAAAIAPILMEFGKDAAAYLGAWGAKKLFDIGVDAFTSKRNATPTDLANRAQAAFNAAKHGASGLNPLAAKKSFLDDRSYETYLQNTPYSQIAQQRFGVIPEQEPRAPVDTFFPRSYKPIRIEDGIITDAPEKMTTKKGPVPFRPLVIDDAIEGPSSRQSQYGYTTSGEYRVYSDGTKQFDLDGTSSVMSSKPAIRKPFALNSQGTIPESQFGYTTGTKPDVWEYITPKKYTDAEMYVHGSQRIVAQPYYKVRGRLDEKIKDDSHLYVKKPYTLERLEALSKKWDPVRSAYVTDVQKPAVYPRAPAKPTGLGPGERDRFGPRNRIVHRWVLYPGVQGQPTPYVEKKRDLIVEGPRLHPGAQGQPVQFIKRSRAPVVSMQARLESRRDAAASIREGAHGIPREIAEHIAAQDAVADLAKNLKLDAAREARAATKLANEAKKAEVRARREADKAASSVPPKVKKPKKPKKRVVPESLP